MNKYLIFTAINMIKFLKILKNTRYLFLTFVIICLLYFGVFTHLFEVDYFSYKNDVNISKCIKNMKFSEPNCKTINSYEYKFLSIPKCEYNTRLVMIIKSAPQNIDNRLNIRETWGYEKRFQDVIIRTVFIVGSTDKKTQIKIDYEKEYRKDIIQADFIDSYFNNTIKTMIGLKWANKYCKSKFYFFSDDDMYVSTKNLLKFIRNPVEYPNNTNDHELPDETKLFAGYVFVSAPHRHLCSKWYTSLSEYPFHLWPPFISAGSYVLSYKALTELYYASFYVKHFRFDDVYLGILAKSVNIEPFHSSHFYFYKKRYDRKLYRNVISSHGYGNDAELLSIWFDQKSFGYA